jgi:hypothetical protein
VRPRPASPAPSASPGRTSALSTSSRSTRLKASSASRWSVPRHDRQPAASECRAQHSKKGRALERIRERPVTQLDRVAEQHDFVHPASASISSPASLGAATDRRPWMPRWRSDHRREHATSLAHSQIRVVKVEIQQAAHIRPQKDVMARRFARLRYVTGRLPMSHTAKVYEPRAHASGRALHAVGGGARPQARSPGVGFPRPGAGRL